MPNRTEKREYCTLTVREVAKLFEAAGVARTERSIINWCQLNKMGVPRLDNYFDVNERRYFISPQSVELVIHEEKAKSERLPHDSERDSKGPNSADMSSELEGEEEDSNRMKMVHKELTDLKILNAGKDIVIDQLRKERDGFIDKLMMTSHRVGELETLLQLEAPQATDAPRKLKIREEHFEDGTSSF